MKAFIAIFVFIFVAGAFGYTAEQKAKGLSVMTACMKTENVTDHEVIQLMKGDFSNASRNVRCFANCFLECAGFTDSTGKLLEGKVIGKLSIGDNKEEVEGAVDACKDIRKDDKCDQSFEIYKCYRMKHDLS